MAKPQNGNQQTMVGKAVTDGQKDAIARAGGTTDGGGNPLGGDIVRGNPHAVEGKAFTDASEAILPVSSEMLAELAKTHECERLHVLKEGEAMRGIVLGEGPTVTMTAMDGEERPVKTWRFQIREGFIVRLLGSHQLDAEMPYLTGADVIVAFNKQIKTRAGRNVNDLFIFKPRGTAMSKSPQLTAPADAKPVTAQ